MIAVAGINYQSAGFTALSRISAAQRQVEIRSDVFSGLVWVQTCNRLELYADLHIHCRKSAEKLLLRQFGVTGNTEGWYILFDDDAILHLLKVAAGLDSAILGEDQILHQLKQAYKNSADQRLNSPFLNKLFHKAFETGKNVRRLTGLNKGNISTASIACGLLQSFQQEYAYTPDATVLIIGAGETGALVTQILVNKGFKNILIWNRTVAKAKALAIQFGVKAIPAKSLASVYSQASMVVVAINKQTPVIDFTQEGTSRTARRIIIDLSLPFQVQEEALNSNNIVYNLEAIAAISQENTVRRKEAVDDALQLVWASLHELKAWKEQEWVGQTIQQWKLLLLQVQERQLKLFAKRNPGVDMKSMAAFGEELSAQLLKQLAWNIRQQEKAGLESHKWSKLLSTVEPYEQLN